MFSAPDSESALVGEIAKESSVSGRVNVEISIGIWRQSAPIHSPMLVEKKFPAETRLVMKLLKQGKPVVGKIALQESDRNFAAFHSGLLMTVVRVPQVSSRTADHEISNDKQVHLCAEKAIERFFGTADDWLVLVEGRVQHHGHGGQRSEVEISRSSLFVISAAAPDGGVVRLSFELAHESCSLKQPIEPFLRSESLKFGVAIEVLRCALRKRTLKFLARGFLAQVHGGGVFIVFASSSKSKTSFGRSGLISRLIVISSSFETTRIFAGPMSNQTAPSLNRSKDKAGWRKISNCRSGLSTSVKLKTRAPFSTTME
jgi:hypothetical protein